MLGRQEAQLRGLVPDNVCWQIDPEAKQCLLADRARMFIRQ
jgi:hypothetical protein